MPTSCDAPIADRRIALDERREIDRQARARERDVQSSSMPAGPATISCVAAPFTASIES
jgi:hypothetical protein